MKIEPLDDLGLCCQVVDDFDDEVENVSNSGLKPRSLSANESSDTD